jgi:Mrp family chromosome partitioning ATPase
MAQNAKMAFLGFGTLSQTTQNFIEEVAKGFGGFEVAGCFDDLRQAAAAITEVVDRTVVAVPNTVLYVHDSVDSATAAAAMNLVNVGVAVQTGWIDWDDFFDGDKDAALQWLGRNSFPPKPDPLDLLLYGTAAPAADPLADLLAATPAPAEPSAEPAPAAAAEPAPIAETVALAAVEPAPAPAVSFAMPEPAEEAPAPKEPAAPVAEAAPPVATFSMPPAAATARPNPLIPGAAATSGKQGDGAAFLAPGPELAQASGPTQAATFSIQSVAPREPRAAVAEFQLPPSVPLPAPVQLPTPSSQKWDEVVDPSKATIQEPAPFPARLKLAGRGAQAPLHPQVGTAFLWTGSCGGSGKTTISWTSANTLAAMFKRSGRATPVYLVETDFGNPKLENRLKIPASNTAIAYLKYLTWLEENAGVQGEDYIAQVEAKAIEQATWTDPVTGLKVIAAPYDTRISTSDAVQDAILRLARKILSEDAIVFFDSGTVGRVDDKALDRELGHLSNYVIIATHAGKRDESGKWVNGSIDDMRRMGTTMSTSVEKGGWGLDRNKVHAFFNRTDFDSFEERRYSAEPFKVSGYVPYEPSLEGKWIGDLQDDPAVDRAVTQIAKAVYDIEKIPELAAFAAAPEPELVAVHQPRRPASSDARRVEHEH